MKQYFTYDAEFKPVPATYLEWSEFMDANMHIRCTEIRVGNRLKVVSSIFIGLRTLQQFECTTFHNGLPVTSLDLRTSSIDELMQWHEIMIRNAMKTTIPDAAIIEEKWNLVDERKLI